MTQRMYFSRHFHYIQSNVFVMVIRIINQLQLLIVTQKQILFFTLFTQSRLLNSLKSVKRRTSELTDVDDAKLRLLARAFLRILFDFFNFEIQFGFSIRVAIFPLDRKCTQDLERNYNFKYL